MTLNTVTPQEQVMIDYVKQYISNNHTISDSMLDLEQTIISNYNNKLIEY